jgi:hypothetical protein
MPRCSKAVRTFRGPSPCRRCRCQAAASEHLQPDVPVGIKLGNKLSKTQKHSVERSLLVLMVQAAVFCSAPCASSHVALSSRGVR